MYALVSWLYELEVPSWKSSALITYKTSLTAEASVGWEALSMISFDLRHFWKVCSDLTLSTMITSSVASKLRLTSASPAWQRRMRESDAIYEMRMTSYTFCSKAFIYLR